MFAEHSTNGLELHKVYTTLLSNRPIILLSVLITSHMRGRMELTHLGALYMFTDGLTDKLCCVS
jgi:hypothetical protein